MEVIISIVFLLILIVMGVPLALAFFASAILLTAIAGYTDTIFLISYGFIRVRGIIVLAIPLFIIAGELMGETGIAQRLIEFTESVIGRFRGSMGVVVNVSCAIFGAVSGSTAAAAACMGSLLIPRMVERGHTRAYSASLLASASVLGVLIPPSIPMIVYGWSANTSVAACFLAGIGPGILLVISLSIVHTFLIRNQPGVQTLPSIGVKESLKKVAGSSRRASLAIAMPFIVLGGIYGGIFTPTEAAAVAVFYALLLGFAIYRTLNFKTFRRSLVTAGSTTGAILFVFFGIQLIARLYVTEDVPERLAALLFGLTENKYLILLMINVLLLVLGMIMDTMSAILAATPLLLPLMAKLGIDPVHFGALMVANLGAGYITPPVAGSLFITQRIAGVDLNQMFRSALVMLFFGFFPVLALTTYVPEVSLFLPRLLGFW